MKQNILVFLTAILAFGLMTACPAPETNMNKTMNSNMNSNMDE